MPHTFSTFTRQDLRTANTSFMAVMIFLFFLMMTHVVISQVGLVIVYSFYFYWQQFHYTKQNMGIGIWKKEERGRFTSAIDHLFYFLVTSIAIIGSFSEGGVQFFGYALINPFGLTLKTSWALALNIAIGFFYIALKPKSWKMALTHVLIFSISFLCIKNFAVGWLLLNVLHNTQYLVFMRNEQKSLRFFFYASLLSFVLYIILQAGTAAAVSVTFMLSLNFTHYVFDGLIWRRNFAAFKWLVGKPRTSRLSPETSWVSKS